MRKESLRRLQGSSLKWQHSALERTTLEKRSNQSAPNYRNLSITMRIISGFNPTVDYLTEAGATDQSDHKPALKTSHSFLRDMEGYLVCSNLVNCVFHGI